MEIHTGSPVCHFSQCVQRAQTPLNGAVGNQDELTVVPRKAAYPWGATYGDGHKRRHCTRFAGGSGLFPTNLCGRNVIAKLKLLDEMVSSVIAASSQVSESLLLEYRDLFEPGLETIKASPVHLQLKKAAIPKFIKARPVPYALCEIEPGKLSRLVEARVFSPVRQSEWAAPIFLVQKKNGYVWPYDGFKLTANVACNTEEYPLHNNRYLCVAMRWARF